MKFIQSLKSDRSLWSLLLMALFFSTLLAITGIAVTMELRPDLFGRAVFTGVILVVVLEGVAGYVFLLPDPKSLSSRFFS